MRVYTPHKWVHIAQAWDGQYVGADLWLYGFNGCERNSGKVLSSEKLIDESISVLAELYM